MTEIVKYQIGWSIRRRFYGRVWYFYDQAKHAFVPKGDHTVFTTKEEAGGMLLQLKLLGVRL